MNRALLVSLFLLSLATRAVAQTKISGTVQCGKPEESHAFEVGDRPNHSFVMSKGKCAWTKPMEIAGNQDKEYTYVSVQEVFGSRAYDRGAGVDSMANGDNAFDRFEGMTTMKNGVPQSAEGSWHYADGTGKLKRIKGKGTYRGTGAADGGMTYKVEGEYTLPSAK